eukprot:3416200-Pyramimonas_sp.AAC.1
MASTSERYERAVGALAMRGPSCLHLLQVEICVLGSQTLVAIGLVLVIAAAPPSATRCLSGCR